jgi:UDP-N-acetylmuramoyl-L-alanine---L-glutamate ligase
MIRNYLIKNLLGKKILILGYGREGRSTLNLLINILPPSDITVADQQESAFTKDQNIVNYNIRTISGQQYLDNLNSYDLIIKSPGIKLDQVITPYTPSKITSQTDLFLGVYGKQTVGITGTKGKSTTSSLLYHILQFYNSKALFGGNIGIPLFDLVDQITPEINIVCELSSHQLQFTRHAPHIAILLNIFQEHLDHYNSYLDYQKAKYNIALNQNSGDYFIYNSADENIISLVNEYPVQSEKVPFKEVNTLQHNDIAAEKYRGKGIYSQGNEIILFTGNTKKKILNKEFESKLTGNHNRNNAIIAASAAALLGVPSDVIEASISTFIPLEHRLEFVGAFNEVKYYNDSISTIPEASIAAVESLNTVDTLILGGFDRTIDYSILADYLTSGSVKNVVTTGPAGLRIFELIKDNERIEELHYFGKFDEAVLKAIEITPLFLFCFLGRLGFWFTFR